MAIGKCLNDWMVYLLYVAELCPSLSISAIEKAIAKMIEEGRFTKWVLVKKYYVVKL